MHQDDRTVKCVGNDIVPDGVGVAVFPVQRIYRPDDRGLANNGQRVLGIVAVGRAEQIVEVHPEMTVQNIVRRVKLPMYLLVALRGKRGMIVCMLRDLVSLAIDPPHRIGIILRVLTDHEKRCLNAALCQSVKETIRVRAGTVVKGQCDQLAALLR